MAVGIRWQWVVGISFMWEWVLGQWVAVAWWVWVERGNSARFFVFEQNGSIQSFVDGFGFLGHVGFKTEGWFWDFFRK